MSIYRRARPTSLNTMADTPPAKRTKGSDAQPDQTPDGETEYLPRELAAIILNMRAALNIEDMLRDEFSILLETEPGTTDAIAVYGLRGVLLKHSAIISGSFALKAFVQDGDDWKPGDLDIFVERGKYENFIDALKGLFDATIPSCAKPFNYEFREHDETHAIYDADRLDSKVACISFYRHFRAT